MAGQKVKTLSRWYEELPMEPQSPKQKMRQMLGGYQVSQALFVAAKLGLADRLASGAQTSEELAAKVQTQPRPLYRLLRTLASFGVFAEDERGRFRLTPLAELLRSDGSGSVRSLALTIGEAFYPAWGELLHSVCTGGTGFEKVFGQPLFEYLAQHPEQARWFDDTMTIVHGDETEPMLDAYDLAEVQILADVGGGNGSVLIAALRRHPHLRGILVDLPGVIERARPRLQAAGLGERCTFLVGNFFESVPAGADAYLLRHILHDWDADRCRRILQNVYCALATGGRVLIAETLIEPGNAPSTAKMLDLSMMVLPGGQERTADEYRQLLESAGFRFSRIIPTAAEVSVIEGRKVDAP